MSEWADGLLADVCVTIRAGGTPQADNQNFYGGEIPFVTIEDISSVGRTIETTARALTAAGLNASAAWLVPPDHLLYSMYATLGKVTRNKVSVATNQAILAIKPDEKLIACDMLFYLLQSMESSVASLSSQTTQANLSADKVRKFKLRFPKSLLEQRHIAEILSTLDEAIDQTEALIAKHQQIKAGLMHDLFTRGVTPDGHLRPTREQAPGLYKESPLGWIPKEWEVKPLAAFTQHDITYGIVQAGPHVENGVPYIRTGDMAGNSLIKDDLLCTSRTIADSYKRSEVRVGEIVCAIRATVGKVLRVPPDLDGANLTQGTARIAPSANTNPAFLLWAIRTERTQRTIMSSIKGTTFSEITLGDLRKLPVAAPSNKDEQKLIGEHLDQSDNMIRAESDLLAKLRQQKQGLMHDLLTGRVRVPPPKTKEVSTMAHAPSDLESNT